MALTSLPRIAVIGAGRMAQEFHLPSQQALVKSRRSVLTSICDLDSRAAAKAAKAFGIPAVYSDIDEMLRTEKPDGVVVIVPVKFTARVASRVLRQGFPVLMEKPPGASPRECRQIIAAAAKSKTPNMVAFNRRFCPVLVQGKAEIVKRGAIKGASGRMYRHLRDDSDFFYSTGIHTLDALRFLGGDIDRVELDRRTVASGERPVYTLIISYANGGVGTLSIRPQIGAQLERYELFGERAVALIHAGVGWLLDTPGSCALYDNNKRVKLPNPQPELARARGPLKTAIAGGFFGENEAFVNALRGGGDFSPSVEDSLQSVEIVHAVQAGKNWRRRG
jgi:predicted dehydrogenase